MCSYLGNFPAYLAGVLRSYGRIEIAIVATSNIFLFNILQRGNGYSLTFNFRFFQFYLETVGDYYTNYRVSRGESVFYRTIYLVNCSIVTRHSNLNLVNYFWENCELVPCRRYSIVLLLIDVPISNIYFLKHHMIERVGWTSRLICTSFVLKTKRGMQRYVVGCDKTEACKCVMCLRQPATLKSIASHSVFRVLFNSASFALSVETSYEEYKFMANSAKISPRRLFPEKALPTLDYSYSYHPQFPPYRYHMECCFGNAAQFWHTRCSVKFNSLDGAIKSIVENKHLYWSSQCDRPLFVTCFTGSGH
jgi:hypothetical protein